MRFIKFDYVKIFNTVLFITMFLLLGIQLILTVPGFKSIITDLGIGESLYAMSDTDEPYLGEITLNIENVDCKGDIIVLQNGEPVAAFFENTVKINVADNTVIEIDGTGYDGMFTVNAVDFSDSISNSEKKCVEVNKNIVILDRYFLK